tara:strand:- start:297 stop:2300 length:2004 start_codon:yes stop_codon:yes gene_type:complete
MAYSNKQSIVPSNINYTSKDFSTIKADLIEYTKAYFPDTYKDFNETSPGMMLIELASYVGDVLSYYIDYNYKESLLTTATERKNVTRLAEFLGYKTTPTTPSIVRLKVTTDIDADADGNPDNSSLGTLLNPIPSGLRIQSNADTDLVFETLGEVDFNMTIPGTPDPEAIAFDDEGIAINYRLTRYVQAISGETKTKQFNITSPTKFLEIDLGVEDVVEILDVKDSSNAKYYEVQYLGQDRILKETHYDDPNSGRETAYDAGLLAGNQVAVNTGSVAAPYTLEYIKTNKKFVKKVDPTSNNTKLQFGNGVYRFNISGSSSAGLFSTIEQQGMSTSGVPSTVINAALNNLTTNNSLNLGETPSNTILTVTYRQGGGATSNAQAGTLTNVINSSENIVVTNDEPASGGTDGETITEIKENAKTFFASQLRCVTREDYQARILNLPAKFGNIAKASVARLNDISGLKIYTLSYDRRRRLTQTPLIVLNNLRMYLEQFRMINDALDFGVDLNNVDPSNEDYMPEKIYSGYKINFGVYFEVNADRRFNPTDVKLEVVDCIKDFFRIDKMHFSQAINLNELRYDILGKDGVIGIRKLQLFQDTENIEEFNASGNNRRVLASVDSVANGLSVASSGYGFQYDFQEATVNDIVRPSKTPSVFEIRNMESDIYGRVI